jgi:putative endonuclease
MGDPRHALGLAAEEAVAAWLTAAGWRVIRHRARSVGGGEVDLVALDPGRILVAIEVRARRTGRSGPAAMSVDGRRVARVGRTLAAIGSVCGEPHRGLRIDLVSVEPTRDPGRWRLTRIPGIG